MTSNGQKAMKSKFLLVVALAIILFCLVTARLLHVPYIGSNYGSSPHMATIFQTALSVAVSSSSLSSSSALEDEPLLNERGTLATRPAVEELISTLRDTTQTAARGEYFLMDLTGEERERWNHDNSCKSRTELKAMYQRRRWANDVEEDDGLWDAVLEEYSKLHRVCMRRIGRENLRHFFETKNNIPGCKFAIADYTVGGGLGNKVIAITNTILYAILTQRVVLVPTTTLVPELMCEPFVGSSWILDSDQFSLPPWSNQFRHMWTTHKDVYRELDSVPLVSFRDLENHPPISKIYASSMEEYQYQPASRFFCDTEQENFKGVTWLYFTGCLYTIPKFFAIPAFRTTLEELFPSKLVLTRMLRSVMLPSDMVWDRIVATDAEHLQKADRRVGLQIRFRHNINEYVQMNNVVNGRILQCGLDNEFLPPLVDLNGTLVSLRAEKSAESSKSVLKVFVASLFSGFADFVAEQYIPHPKLGGVEVTIVQLSHELNQAYGLEIDRQSLVEIMMLSFCDDLLVTPLSTFGGLAQAYGNLLPWILDFRKDNPSAPDQPPCQRGQTVDPCYQEADKDYSCTYDKSVGKKRISDVVPYIQKCLEVDVPNGLQLLTKTPNGTMEFPLPAYLSTSSDLLG